MELWSAYAPNFKELDENEEYEEKEDEFDIVRGCGYCASGLTVTTTSLYHNRICDSMDFADSLPHCINSPCPIIVTIVSCEIHKSLIFLYLC